MKIVNTPPGFQPDKDFTGVVNLAKILEGTQGDPLTLYRVSFAAAARTDWHAHQGVQVLYIESGECFCQTQGQPVQRVAPGNVIVIEADEKHWHGAGPQEKMVHLAIGLYQDTQWFEAVTDRQYSGLDR